LQDRSHFEVREASAEAAADAAAERDPRLEVSGPPEEALGTEGQGLRVEIGAAMEEHDARAENRSGRQLVAGNRDWPSERACEVRDRRSQAQDFLYDRVEIGLLTGP
jgi:hypothetical protein